MWQGVVTRIPEVDAAAFRAKRAEYGLGPLVIHANYLINLASAQQMLRVRSIQAFHDELVRTKHGWRIKYRRLEVTYVEVIETIQHKHTVPALIG